MAIIGEKGSMSKTKKLLSFVFALLLSVSLFAGCNLVTVNNSVYYDEVVAEIVYDDSTKEFTFEDLLNAYNSYGYQYVQNGSTTEEAVKSTVDTMIDRYILLQELKKQITLTEAELNQLKRDTYDQMNDTLLELEDTIREEWNLTRVDGEEESTEDTSLRDAYEAYEPTIELENDMLVRIIAPETNIDLTPAGNFEQVVTDESVSAEAMKRYIRSLRDSAESEGLTDLTNEELIQKEVDRIYDLLVENEYLQKYSDEYVNTLPVSTDEVVARYKELYAQDYYTYLANVDAYHTAMRSDASGVYYNPVANKYLNVTHILIKFSDEQNSEIAELDSLLTANSITQEVYDYRLSLIKNQTVVTYNTEDGGVATKSAEAVYNEVYDAVNQYSKNTGTGLVLRAQTFNDYIYKYNDDTGIMNADYAYVVNLTDEEGFDDIMIPEFTEASRELYTNPEAGDGAISDLVFAEFSDGEYGYHIIMDLGVVKNLVEPGNLANITWQTLYNHKTQPSSNMSLFEEIYDELDLDSSRASTRMSQLVSTAKLEVQKINKYESVYKTLWD